MIREQVEEKTGKDFCTAVEELAARGLSKAAAARELGVSEKSFSDNVRGLAPNVEWVTKNQKGMKGAYVIYEGKLTSLWDIGREIGVSHRQMRRRYQQYLKDGSKRKLLRKNWRTRSYSISMTMDDWEAVMEYARARSIKAAKMKFGVPEGAIRAMLDGDWERVA